jgi:hypothetical protein
VRYAFVPILAALVAGGCASSKSAPPRPPKLGRSGPPPAWVETEHASRWLGYSSYCWRSGRKGLCADYVHPSCNDKRHPPTILVHEGETVRFHLGYDPTEVTANTERLDASRDPRWRVEHGGFLALFTKGKAGDASYVGCVRLTEST